MARQGRTVRVRHVGEFEWEHPILHFIFVRPFVWIGKVWLHLLVSKHHLWAMASPAPFHRLTYFGPAGHPLASRPAPILVGVSRAGRGSSPDPVGDTELSTEKHG